MKVNVAVPSLQLPGDAVSISSSSQSVCSTLSSFRDPLLASFEEELLISSSKPALAKTQTSWSKMKGLISSSRQAGRSNSLGANLNNSGYQGDYSNSQSRSASRGVPDSRRQSSDSRHQITVSISQESEASGVSYRSCHVCQSANSVSDFADSLARRLLCEAITAAYCHTPEPVEAVSHRQAVALNLYADLLAQSILSAAVETVELMDTDWLEQNKVVTWSDEVENVKVCIETNSEHEVQTREFTRLVFNWTILRG